MTHFLQFNQSKELHFQLKMSDYQLEMTNCNSKPESVEIFNIFNQ